MAENFKGAMLVDLNAMLSKGGSNEELVNDIKDFMSAKYVGLEVFCLVYDDMDGSEFKIGGFRVESLHRNGKCGIVYYRTKGEPPRFSYRYDDAQKINRADCSNASEGFKNIVVGLFEEGIGCDGCAVIRVGHDLQLASTFSTKHCTATDTGPNATSIVLLQ